MPPPSTYPLEVRKKNTKIAAVVFEEAREANPATSTQPEASKASVNNVAIKTEPADAVAKEDIIIAIPNPSTDANLGYFDPKNMEVESSEALQPEPLLKP